MLWDLVAWLNFTEAVVRLVVRSLIAGDLVDHNAHVTLWKPACLVFSLRCRAMEPKLLLRVVKTILLLEHHAQEGVSFEVFVFACFMRYFSWFIVRANIPVLAISRWQNTFLKTINCSIWIILVTLIRRPSDYLRPFDMVHFFRLDRSYRFNLIARSNCPLTPSICVIVINVEV